MDITVLGKFIGTGRKSDYSTFYDLELNETGITFVTPDGVKALDECKARGASSNIRIDVLTGEIAVMLPGLRDEDDPEEDGDDPDIEEISVPANWAVLL